MLLFYDQSTSSSPSRSTSHPAAQEPGKAVVDGLSAWLPATHVGDPEKAPIVTGI